MKNNLFILCALLFSSSLIAQDKSRDLEDYTDLSVSGGIEVTLYQGIPHADITMVKGDYEELEFIQKGSSLKIKFKSNNMNWSSGSRKAVIELYGENLSAISSSAGAALKTNYTIKADDFEVDASSGSTMSVSLESNSLDVDISSGASIKMDGKTKTLEVDASSGAAYKGTSLMAKEADADVSSGASIKLWVTDEFEANASSGGSIKYKGDPEKVNVDAGKWSGGSIRKM